MIKDVVISRYNEDISWVENINSDVKVYLYNKGENISYNKYLKLPNIGREAHTYLHHICLNYNNLPDYIHFFQGYPFDHTGDCIDIINGNKNVWDLKTQLYYDGYWGYAHNSFGTMWALFPSIHFSGSTLTSELNGNPYHPGLPIQELWYLLFKSNIPHVLEFTPGNQFTVDKKLITNRSLLFWEDLLYFSENRNTFPWEFERLMPYILHPNYITLK
jgi:hypothetical protein